MALENSKETSNEITIEEIQELDRDSYLMVDIRDEGQYPTEPSRVRWQSRRTG